jgi:hypothetical protein
LRRTLSTIMAREAERAWIRQFGRAAIIRIRSLAVRVKELESRRRSCP